MICQHHIGFFLVIAFASFSLAVPLPVTDPTRDPGNVSQNQSPAFDKVRYAAYGSNDIAQSHKRSILIDLNQRPGYQIASRASTTVGQGGANGVVVVDDMERANKRTEDNKGGVSTPREPENAHLHDDLLKARNDRRVRPGDKVVDNSCVTCVRSDVVVSDDEGDHPTERVTKKIPTQWDWMRDASRRDGAETDGQTWGRKRDTVNAVTAPDNIVWNKRRTSGPRATDKEHSGEKASMFVPDWDNAGTTHPGRDSLRWINKKVSTSGSGAGIQHARNVIDELTNDDDLGWTGYPDSVD